MAEVPVPSRSLTDDVNIATQTLASLTTTLDASLYSNGGDELRALLLAEDGNDDPAALNVDASGNLQVDASLSQSTVGLLDSNDSRIDPLNQAALRSVGADELRINVENNNAGGLGTVSQPGLEYGDQSVSSPGTTEALNGGNSVGVPNGQAVLLKAHVASPSNGDEVYVHDSNTSGTSGYPLADGETVSLNVDDVAKIHVDADTGGDGVDWILER